MLHNNHPSHWNAVNLMTLTKSIGQQSDLRWEQPKQACVLSSKQTRWQAHLLMLRTGCSWVRLTQERTEVLKLRALSLLSTWELYVRVFFLDIVLMDSVRK